MKPVQETMRDIRISKNISQGELGKELGLDQGKICLIEKGFRKISTDELYKIAKFLKVSIDELFNYKPEGIRLIDIVLEVRELKEFVKIHTCCALCCPWAPSTNALRCGC